MAHTHTNLLFHIVFSTKERVPMLDAELKPRLFAYMGGIFRELGGKALLINGPSDHVHMLALLPAKLGLSEVVGFRRKANQAPDGAADSFAPTGLKMFATRHPWLTPWATFSRHSVPGN